MKLTGKQRTAVTRLLVVKDQPKKFASRLTRLLTKETGMKMLCVYIPGMYHIEHVKRESKYEGYYPFEVGFYDEAGALGTRGHVYLFADAFLEQSKRNLIKAITHMINRRPKSLAVPKPKKKKVDKVATKRKRA